MEKTMLHPTTIVIFGGTGDLAQTKLLPALYHLYCAQKLPQRCRIIGLSRKELTDGEYQTFVRDSIVRKHPQVDEATVAEFCQMVRYIAGSFAEAPTYDLIKEALAMADNECLQCTNKLFYLSVPPDYYETIFDFLHNSDAMALCNGIDSWSRLLVEKPFGRDLTTAQALEKRLCQLFRDEQIYRIDHYLAKDAIENIIALRFVNSVLADSWQGTAIESIHIRLLETKDVSNRGSFYDAIGTLRDVGQNHLLQIFALLTMSPANVHQPEAVRHARAAALATLATATTTHIERGQYEGYATSTGVADCSQTETYFKITFTLADALWHGTQFTLEAGKALHEQCNEAVITFRAHNECSCGFAEADHEHKNVLRIQFAPTDRMTLSMWTKQPGFTFGLREQELVLDEKITSSTPSPEAYEQVLYDCIRGDQTRFVSGEEVEHAWRFITPILETFQTLPLPVYKKGSVGPGGY